jgi:8-hydroxy-5-deazaflavin:NADPH oxidoreductase
MKVAVVGAGRIGGNVGEQLGRKGHEVMLSFSRDEAKLRELAAGIEGASTGTPGEAVEFAEAVVFAVPWRVVGEAVQQMGRLDGKVVVDTTNQFGSGGVEELPDGSSAVELNAGRMPGAALAKAFNTLTSGFQREVAAERPGEVAMFFAAEDGRAAEVASALVADCGFAPVRIGGWSEVALMEAPRRPGSVYGEAYRPADAERIAAAAQAGNLEEAARLAEELKAGEERA